MKLMSYFDDEDTSKILLLNSQYVPPMKNEETGKWSDGVLYLTYRDLNDKQMKVKEIVNPESETFITKPEYRSSFKTQRLYLEEHKVDRYRVKYNSITKFIQDKIREDGKDIDLLKVTSNSTNIS